MKKKIFFLIVLLVVLTAAFTACGLFGKKTTQKKVQLTEDMIYSDFVGMTYIYSGNPIEFEQWVLDVRVNGNYVDRDLFEMEFSDNVEVGTANVKITAKEENEYVKGSVTVHFYIEANSGVYCGTDDNLATMLASTSVSGVQVDATYTVAEGVTVTVPEGKKLYLTHGVPFTNYGTILNYGTIIIEGAHMYRESRRNTEFTNYGVLSNYGTIEIRDYVMFEDNGVFTSDNEITSRGTVYLRDEDKTFLVDGAEGTRYIRERLAAADISVEECSFKQYYSFMSPMITLPKDTKRFDVTYQNNDRAGVAQATVSMRERDQFYYGEATASFVIKKGNATVSKLEDLKKLISSENFDNYTFSKGLTVPEENDLTIPVGSSLTVDGALTVSGDVTLKGDMTVTQCRVEAGGSFKNDGLLTVSGNSFSVGGTFINQIHGDWVYENHSVSVGESGNFINQGSLVDKIFELYGTIRNEGALSLRITYNRGAFVNVGTASFSGYSGYTNASFLNEQGGRVTLNGDCIFTTPFTNAGKVVNLGRIAFQENVPYSCSGTFDNSAGDVWAFATLQGVANDSHFHLKKNLTDESVSVLVEYVETIYNTKNQQPALTVDGMSPEEADCRVIYSYRDSTATVTECVKTGEIVMRLSSNGTFYPYAGSKEIIYRILPATIRVEDYSGFSKAVKDGNYSEIILDADVEMSNYNYDSIGSKCTLNLNGHKIVIRSSFYLYGTLTGGSAVSTPFVPSEETASIIVESRGLFTNYGTLQNEGFFLVKGGGHFYGNTQNSSGTQKGVVINNGVIYTDRYFTVQSGTGRVVVRRDINESEIKELFQMPEVYFDNTDKTPVPAMTYKGNSVNMTRFDYTYTSNRNAGTAQIKVTVHDAADADFYGTASLSFVIRRGVKEVNSTLSLIQAAEDLNYQIIRLTADFTLTENVEFNAEQTLDLMGFDIIQSGANKIKFGTNCRLILTTADEARLAKYAFAADEIILSDNITALDGTRTKITSGQGNTSTYRIPYLDGAVNYSSTVVHLDGYSFTDGLYFENDHIGKFNITFENSSENTSKIGADIGGYALRLATCSKATNVTLRNITVYGAEYNGGHNTDVLLTVEYCKFIAGSTEQESYAFKAAMDNNGDAVFDHCRFEGASAVYIDGRRNYDFDTSKEAPAYFFNDCTMYAYGPHDATSNSDYYGATMILDNKHQDGICVQITDCYLYSQRGNNIQINKHQHNLVNYYLVGDNTFEHPIGATIAVTPYYENHRW